MVHWHIHGPFLVGLVASNSFNSCPDEDSSELLTSEDNKLWEVACSSPSWCSRLRCKMIYENRWPLGDIWAVLNRVRKLPWTMTGRTKSLTQTYVRSPLFLPPLISLSLSLSLSLPPPSLPPSLPPSTPPFNCMSCRQALHPRALCRANYMCQPTLATCDNATSRFIGCRCLRYTVKEFDLSYHNMDMS